MFTLISVPTPTLPPWLPMYFVFEKALVRPNEGNFERAIIGLNMES